MVDLKDWAQTINIHLTHSQLDQFRRYAETLVQWNKKMNITRITSPRDIAIKHFFDSLAVVSFIENFRHESILDVGSGGGFPGIPLSLVLPDATFTLLDASRKRVHFLKYVSHVLGTHHVHVCCDRLESFQPDKKYDIIISRAFTDLSRFASLSKPLLDVSGRIIAMKGQHVFDELNQFDASGYNITIKSYDLPVINQKRYLVLLALK